MTGDSEPSYDVRRGALLMVASALLFAAMAATVSLLARELRNAPIVFFRHFLMLVFLLPWLWRNGRSALATRDPRGHLARGLAGVAAVACYFYAIARLRQAYRQLYRSGLRLEQAIAEIDRRAAEGPELAVLGDFLRGSTRGIVR